MICRRYVLLLLCLAAMPMAARAAEEGEAGSAEFFEKRVRPVLVASCQKCHGPEKQEQGLRVDSLAALLKGGETGPAVVPGKPEASLLVGAINHGEVYQMPPKTKLPAAQIADLTAWVKLGAPWPEATVSIVPAPQPENANAPLFTAEQRAFWAFQPPVAAAPPEVRDSAWCQSPIDRFILAGLEAKGLSPAPSADKRTLIRRATFDLLGLPPTPEEVEAFVADTSPQAFARVVDRLLASPHYGQRWGRHWLDVARYADSNGMDENVAYANAFRYRDYVVAAFNKDKPYDQFVREQIAGDLLANPASPDATAERLTATGFLVIGPKMLAEDDPLKMEMDIVDEQLDTVGRTFMGLTLGCARCHDHKFDPLPAADYYSLAGIFKSTKTMENFKVVAMWHERSIATAEQVAAREQAVASAAAKKAAVDAKARSAGDAFVAEARAQAEQYLAAAKEFKAQPPEKAVKVEQWAAERKLHVAFLQQWLKYLESAPADRPLAEMVADPKGPFALPKDAEQFYPEATKAELTQLRAEATAAEKAVPVLPTAMAASEGNVTNLKVHLRGNYLTQGAETPRQFLRIIAGEQQTPIDGSRSGRRELAQWMTSPQHPLTSRVMVNRLWHWHFGNGIVRSPDNFGRLGEASDNQPLLDWLAVKLVEQGWSLKAMHRAIMLSSTYQMSTAHNAQAALVDPENRLHWRTDRRRLEAEALRDGVLLVTGELDETMGGTLLKTANHGYVTSTASEKLDVFHVGLRSIYLPITRSSVYDLFQAFDFADPSAPNGQRATTTIAPQALALMNSRLIEDRTRQWAQRLLGETTSDDAARIRTIYERAYSRPPNPEEVARAIVFVQRVEAAGVEQKLSAADARLQAWQSLCRVVLASSEFVYVE